MADPTYVDKKELLLNELTQMDITKATTDAMSLVEREMYVLEEFGPQSYDNIALPIGHEQTISQPYTVAFMIDLLNIKPTNKILEIGSGSGYNAAVMSRLLKSGKVFSLEIVPQLAEFAKRNIEKENIKNVEIINANGYEGYEDEAPYDRIIVTATSEALPQDLVDQLKKGGILVMPIDINGSQVMTKFVKDLTPIVTQHGNFSFVPFRKE